MQSVPVDSFLGRTDNSNGRHMVLEGVAGLYLRVLVPTPSRSQQRIIQAYSFRQYQVIAI